MDLYNFINQIDNCYFCKGQLKLVVSSYLNGLSFHPNFKISDTTLTITEPSLTLTVDTKNGRILFIGDNLLNIPSFCIKKFCPKCLESENYHVWYATIIIDYPNKTIKSVSIKERFFINSTYFLTLYHTQNKTKLTIFGGHKTTHLTLPIMEINHLSLDELLHKLKTYLIFS